MALVNNFTRGCDNVVAEEMSTDDLLDYLELTDLLRVMESNMVNQFLQGDTNRRRQVRDTVRQQVEALYTSVMGLDPEGNVVGCDPGCPMGGQCRQCQPA